MEDIVDASSETDRDLDCVNVGVDPSVIFVFAASVWRLRVVVGRAVVVVVDIVVVDACAG